MNGKVKDKVKVNEMKKADVSKEKRYNSVKNINVFLDNCDEIQWLTGC